MKREFDVVVIGAGPAGMSAAIRLREQHMRVLVVDEQPAPGGQIWRAVETVAGTRTGRLLGDEYRAGAALAEHFRQCGAVYEPQTQVWQIETGWHVYMTRGGRAQAVRADQVLLAIGAQERPAPFPGWTLPGVLTVGAAQILLKTSNQVPAAPVWVAGSGPLPLLYMAQLLRAGGQIAGWLDTSAPGAWRRALPWAGAALASWGDIRKGLGWLRELKAAGVRRVRGVTGLRALGEGALREIEYTLADGSLRREPASVLLSHEGVVPSIHMTRALECAHHWDARQSCLAPDLDDWGQTSREGVYVAGDAAGIGGALAACARGELAALGMALRAGRMTAQAAGQAAAPLREKLRGLLRIRPMLDEMYPPRAGIFNPPDETIVCRCEELTAGDIRRAARIGQPGPNQVKSYTRAGMGPCQGRQCGYTVAHIVAAEERRPVSEVGFYRIRPPLKPLTLGELASLDVGDDGVVLAGAPESPGEAPAAREPRP
ncbi:pyridine nucleotide-disulfide oxidoreductase [Bordetella hinzii CA90 BAL1384]|uniref:FAD/NAD(P)-dependent oxidoreductase n=2 Tax=Bordetella hinzii TaxID=103855 RepID=UPI00045A4A96|nr:NAD(P)/FAD-dependent oxidoreductase [Bordetella hinzii]KCB34136.1 pyridine nucleotide-disulfide oxidoreductase [Bordetella hinzii CA90 BAL1384]QWF37658.1 FAD-dependent oxidoreductase [Bordetella hinzii]QWF42202.1 FAD-dependent oxidoreductase [Bordetella hinzii]QWF46744.1 FAD-dependent oxidoreductase [Bordetella hinzii]QWF51283.1 FAD-dependent oxidoreductase [Bordetella hinzii]